MSKWNGSGSLTVHRETLPGSLCAADAVKVACWEGFRSGTSQTDTELLERLCYGGDVVAGGEREASGSGAGWGIVSVETQASLMHQAKTGVAARHTAPRSGPTVLAYAQRTAGYYQADGASGFAAAAAASGLGSWMGWSRVKCLGAPSPLCSPVPAEEGTA